MHEYIRNRSLWLDEAFVALNVLDKSISQLLTQPFDYRQAAPVMYILLTKFLVLIFGSSEYVLRFIPLLAGIASIFVFFILVKRLTGGKGILIALIFFSFSTMLLRYSVEVKQYSTDVLISLLILYCGLSFLSIRFNLLRALTLGAIGACAVWLSHPSAFMLAGLGLALLYRSFSKKDLGQIHYWCLSISIWVVSFGIFYFLSLRHIEHNSELRLYWAESFMPVPLSLQEAKLFYKLFLGMFWEVGGMRFDFLGLFLFLLGSHSVYKRDRKVAILLLAPLVFTVIASFMHKYPFKGRLLLFYAPVLYILVTEGLVFFVDNKLLLSKAIGSVLICVMLWHPIVIAPKHLSSSLFHSEEIRPALEYLRSHFKEGDDIYLYYSTYFCFKYYAENYGFEDIDYIKGVQGTHDREKYIRDLSRLKGRGRVWFIFTHVQKDERAETNDEEYIVTHLDTLGKQSEHIQSDGASLYLYELN
ncbi:MAG: glycosyltransferase family 39 protein [Candidatus Omnitrophica bacterium]|nr:glycosyltransferase family 39 protein [Candidatus Omnitrophota bacterium]